MKIEEAANMESESVTVLFLCYNIRRIQMHRYLFPKRLIKVQMVPKGIVTCFSKFYFVSGNICVERKKSKTKTSSSLFQ